MIKRLALALMAPVIFLMILEVVLRLSDYGYPTSFLRPTVIDGEEVYVDNPYFGYRFFPPEITRAPVPLRITRMKASDGVRMVILGESAAMGEPTPEIGLAPVLSTLLASACPATQIEVINAGMTAINSHVIREIATSITSLNPDVCIIYMGNNEVVGPYGPGTVLSRFSSCSGFTRLRVLLSRLRLSQLIRTLTPQIHPTPQTWEGMEMFLPHIVEASDQRMDNVYSQFADNLDAMIHTLSASDIRVVLSTMPVNLFDQEPFGSSHAQDIFAEAHSITAQTNKAGDLFAAARDLDHLRFRADTSINRIIRCYAASNRNNLIFFDAEKVAATHSRHTAPGDDLFLDHVHLNTIGTYLLASNLTSQLLGAHIWPCDSSSKIPSYQTCMEQMPWSTWSELEAIQIIAKRLDQPPFPRTPANRKRIVKLMQQQAGLQEKAFSELTAYMENTPEPAQEISPADTAVQNLEWGRIYLDIDAYSDAQAALEIAVKHWPHRYDIRGHLAVALAFQTNTEEAIQVLASVPKPDPRMMISSLLHTTRILRRHKQARNALFLLQPAFETAPQHPDILYEMALCYAANGNHEKAETLFKQISSTPGPHQTEAKLEWALFLTMQDRWPEAQKIFLDLMSHEPEQTDTRLKYAMALQYAGYIDDAQQELESLSKTNPDNTEAWLQLGKLCARRGHHQAAQNAFNQLQKLQPWRGE